MLPETVLLNLVYFVPDLRFLFNPWVRSDYLPRIQILIFSFSK